MPRALLFALLLAWSAVTAGSALADTRYVSDQLIITLRAAPDADSAVLTTLKTDSPLEVLEDDGRFLKVRTESGQEGYVLSQYVTSDLPKSQQLAQLTKERDALQQKVKRLESDQGATSNQLEQAHREQEAQAKELQAKLAATEQELTATKRQLAAVTSKYEALQQDAKDVVKTANERDRLQQQQQTLNTELARLREENNTLLRTGMIQWFLAGGGVFFIGWVAGKLSRKKRRSF